MNDSGNALDFVTSNQYAVIGSGQLSLEDTTTDPNKTPPWVQFPEGGYAFDYQGQVAMPGIGLTATVMTFTVGDGYDGVIKRLSINFTGGGFAPGSGDLIYRITLDGRPAKGYSNILADLGSPLIPRPTDGIRIFSNQVVAITVTHVANVMLSQPVYATLAGYYYPRGGE